MSFARLFSILRARWWVGLSVLVASVVITFLVCLALPARYTAVASVLIDGKPDPLTSALTGGTGGPAFVATQIDVIQSDRVGTRVVRDLRLTENPLVQSQWQADTKGQGSIEAWLSDSLRRSLEVAPSSLGSNIINVSYRAQDPRFASALANAFVQAYIATSLELRVDPARQYSTFFDTRSKEARDALERAQSKLTDFQREKGIIVTDERMDIENSRLGELSSQLVALQSVATESGSRAKAAGGSADQMSEVLNNGVISGMKSELAHSEAKLQELNSRYGENHPQVIELKANLAELRQRMNAEIARVTGGFKVSNSINRQRESELRGALDAQRATVLRLRNVKDQGAVLMRDVESAQRAYDSVLTRLTSSSLESLSTQSSAFALSQATPPVASSFPKVFLSVLAAAVIGTLIGVILMLLMEILDRRVRVGEDVTETLGLPIIGVIPRPSQKRLFASIKESKMQQRLMPQVSMSKGV